MQTRQLLLRVEGIVKAFPGLMALDGVSLDVRSGEVVAVVGHNGSGKSTLVKVLAGIYQQDAGTVALETMAGQTAELHFIHQDLGLVPALSAVENLNLVQASSGALAPLRTKGETRRARSLLSRFGQQFDVHAKVSELTPAQRAIVAIARALEGWAGPHNVLVLDEPTEALHKNEVDILFSAVRSVAGDGAGVIFISHRLDEVLDLADRVVVLRDGVKVADERAQDLDHGRLVELVTGSALSEQREHVRRERGADAVLRIRGLRGAVVDGLDLDLRPGETVGVAGVLGSGREEVPSLVFGADGGTSAEYLLHGRPYERRSAAASIRNGLAFVAGDRARFGSVPQLNARENITLPRLGAHRSRMGAISIRRERAEAARLAAVFDVKPARTEQRFGLFSGGNQQKIVMAKWLRNTPSVLLLEEPTQGVDIGAKAAIYAAVDGASAAGAAVLVCSSDAKELVRLCDRVLVLREGRVAAELSGDELTERRLVLEGYGLVDEQAVPHPSI
ncbi:sugar ABC transporter ATP-binding protein [Herbiconiux sp. CPCC 203407]|uniref:Sugar ABC transporter ATP-binding protein n=1 Tax=Herbiconiux oxytropis TaxID=2970915 RepID=A0AA41XAJ9_9MICO|nr:sugar ABC transporter ATP-binding protein [Herbiconiux oxytropis]MCS5721570.1 sugar ABC transporter ATP-binding protein [Herbiconiux oxytropis]MCS5724647.1 sugar ABC transporter ATP-binding protein [Herbiconiux oxytropis]